MSGRCTAGALAHGTPRRGVGSAFPILPAAGPPRIGLGSLLTTDARAASRGAALLLGPLTAPSGTDGLRAAARRVSHAASRAGREGAAPAPGDARPSRLTGSSGGSTVRAGR